MIVDDELLDCFLNLPEIIPGANNVMPSPLNFKWLELKQSQDTLIKNWVQKYPQNFLVRPFNNNINLVTYVRTGDDPNMHWKIILPENIITQVIKWFH